MNVALAIILDTNKVLIGKIRPEKVAEYGGLEYAFPSEGIRDVSTVEKEIIDEVKKQTNLDINIVQKIGERVHPFTKNYTYYFHCEQKHTQILATAKDTDIELFMWCDINNLSKYMPSLFDEVKNYLDKVAGVPKPKVEVS